MDKIQLTEEVLKVCFEDIYSRFKHGELGCDEAAEKKNSVIQ